MWIRPFLRSQPLLSASQPDALERVEGDLCREAVDGERGLGVSHQSPTLPTDEQCTPPASWPRRAVRAIGSGGEWCFGLLAMIVALAIAATVPIFQFVSLGYLLEVSARIARSGRLRDGLFGFRAAARAGGAVVGLFLTLAPVLLISDLYYSARLVAPDSVVTARWRIGLGVAVTLFVMNAFVALGAGGRFRYFFWLPLLPVLFVRALWGRRPARSWLAPVMVCHRLGRGEFYGSARDATWTFLANMQLPHLFWLGVRGFLGALVWLTLPTVLLIGASTIPVAPLAVLSGLAGGVLLTIVLLYLPFLQAWFAAENRWGAMFDVRAVRQLFERAPIAFWFGLLITLLFALPLYLLKIEATPREVTWLPGLAFVAFILPARMIAGWAVSRGLRREVPRHSLNRWLARLAALPVAGMYVLLVFLSQYLSWYGIWSLFEQHAFLLPVPFLGL